MDDIIFTCQKCGIDIEADSSFAGSVAECPNCENTVMIPAPGIHPSMEIDEFVVKKRLGVGDMGEVWLAEATNLQCDVILKILSPALTSDPELMARFRQEIKNIAKLDHPHTSKAIKAGSDKGISYLAATYIKGDTLAERIKRGAISEEIALKYAKSIADALSYAWENHQILHRNINLNNIIITDRGEAKITDFGLSKSMSEDVSITRTGIILGTPAYMSPEQARMADDIDFRSDIYSLGATLYHIATGKKPYDGISANQVFINQLNEQFPSAKKSKSSLSAGFNQLVAAMTAKLPENRPESWDAVLTDIDLILKGKSPLSKAPKASKTSKTKTKGKSEKKKKTESYDEVLKNRKKTAKVPKKAKVHAEPSDKTQVFTKFNMVIAGIVLVLVLIGTVFLIYYAMDQSERRESLQEQRIAEKRRRSRSMLINKQTREKAEHEEKVKFVTAFRYAQKYKDVGEYGKAAVKLQEVLELYPNSKYSQKTKDQLGKLADLKVKDCKEIIEKLKDRAKKYADSKNFHAALNLFKNYDGKLLKETATERGVLEAKYQKKYDAQRAARSKEIATARKNREKVIESLTSLLVKRKYDSAIAKFNKSPYAKHIPEVKKVLEEMKLIKPAIVQSYRKDIGKTMVFTVKGKSAKYKLDSVSDKDVVIAKKLGKAMVKNTVKYNSLSVAERVKRVDGKYKYAANLYGGIQLIRKKDYKEAKRFLRKTAWFAKPMYKKCD